MSVVGECVTVVDGCHRGQMGQSGLGNRHTRRKADDASHSCLSQRSGGEERVDNGCDVDTLWGTAEMGSLFRGAPKTLPHW